MTMPNLSVIILVIVVFILCLLLFANLPLA